MKRDLGLVRRMLLVIEASPSGFRADTLDLAGYTSEQVAYHLRLVLEAGLVMRLDETSPAPSVLELSWDGHEFADAARDELRWGRAMRIVGEKAGTVTADVLRQLLTALMKGTLGLP